MIFDYLFLMSNNESRLEKEFILKVRLTKKKSKLIYRTYKELINFKFNMNYRNYLLIRGNNYRWF